MESRPDKVLDNCLTTSFKDFLDLMKTQFGDKTREEMEAMLKSGMSMEQVRLSVDLRSKRSKRKQSKKTIKLRLRCLGHGKQHITLPFLSSLLYLDITQVLEHFQREAEKKELKNKLQALLDDQNASTEEIFNALRFCLFPFTI